MVVQFKYKLLLEQLEFAMWPFGRIQKAFFLAFTVFECIFKVLIKQTHLLKHKEKDINEYSHSNSNRVKRHGSLVVNDRI